MEELVKQRLTECGKALSSLIADDQTLSAIAKASELIVQAFKSGGSVFSCGNGGSMCDAMHFAEELSGKFQEERAPLPAMAISDPAHLSCVANDFGYDQVFSRFVEAHGKPQDLLFAISTSGKSPNVLKAAQVARKKGMRVIALTGRSDSLLSGLSDIDICTPTASKYSDRIQELHIKCIHIIIELCEKSLFYP